MSSKFDYKKIMPRYSIIAIAMTLVAIAVILKAFYTMTADRQYWMDVAARLKVDSMAVKPIRGNILSSDGQLLQISVNILKRDATRFKKTERRVHAIGLYGSIVWGIMSCPRCRNCQSLVFR